MAQETEIKLPIEDLRKLRQALKRLGARQIARMGRVHERNVLFDTPGNALKRRGELLRIRSESRGSAGKTKPEANARAVILTLKRPIRRGAAKAKGSARPARHKVREEIELRLTDADALTKVFDALALRPWFRYEKFRTTFRLPKSHRWAAKLLIELDETPIGTFVELEGPAGAIDRAALELGFSRADYITANYFVLYREECGRRGVQVRDMVFAKKK